MEMKRDRRKEKENDLVFPWHYTSQSLTSCQVPKQEMKGTLQTQNSALALKCLECGPMALLTHHVSAEHQWCTSLDVQASER